MDTKISNNSLSKLYKTTLAIWIISSLAGLFIAFFAINFNNEIIRFIACLLSGLSSILTIFVIQRKLKPLSNTLLIIFPVILFLCFYFFDYRIDYSIYLFYFLATLIYLFYALFIKITKKNDELLVHAIFPLVYSGALMVIKIIQLDRYITLINDDLISIFLILGLIGALISIVVYLIVQKNRSDLKKYIVNLLLTAVTFLAFTFGIPYCFTNYLNYTFDLSHPTTETYTIVDKEHRSGGRGSTRYSVIIMVNNQKLKVNLTLLEYEKFDVYDQITLSRHTGFLNLEYFEYTQ